MRPFSRLLTLLLALAAFGRLAGVAASGDGMVTAVSTAPSPGHDAGEGRHCDHPTHQTPTPRAPMPCDTGMPDCPLMAGCMTMGPAAIVLPVEHPSPTVVIAFAAPATGHGQYAPVPDSPPPRA
jgi:hypothetical protein